MKLKLFGKNAAIYSIGNIALRGVAFLLIPVYTHSLSVKEFGLLATILVTIQFLLVVMGLGMRNTLLRFVSEYEEKGKIGYLIGCTSIINMVGGIIVTTIVVLFFVSFFKSIFYVDEPIKLIFLVCGVSLIQSIYLHFIAYFTAKNEGKKFLISSLFAAIFLFTTIMVSLFVFNLGIEGILYAHFFAYGVVSLVILVIIINKTGFKFSFPISFELLKFGFPLIFSMSGLIFIGTSSTYLLSYFSGLESVAVFRLGYKLAQTLTMFLILPFQMAFQPFVFANLKNAHIKQTISNLFSYLLFAVTFCSLAIMVGSKAIFPFIAPESYSGALLAIILTLPSIAFSGVTVVGECLLAIKKRTYINGTVIGVGALLNFGLNILLIPLLNWYGLALSLLITHILIASCTISFGVSSYPIKFEWKRIILAAVLFVSFTFLVFSFSSLDNYLFYLLITIFVSVALSFLYFSNVFNDLEKKFVKNLFYKIQPKFTP